MSGQAGTILTREMGYSSGEFAGVLPRAMRDWGISGGPSDWAVSTADGEPVAKIRIRELPDRAMGSLRLPVLAVEIDLGAATSDRAAEFMHRFERGFHRGGG